MLLDQYAPSKQLRSADSQKVKHELDVPSLTDLQRPFAHPGSETLPIEASVIAIVHGAMSRARTILSRPGDRFDIDISLVGTHGLSTSDLDMRFLADALDSGCLQRQLGLDKDELSVLVFGQGAASRHDTPGQLTIGLQRLASHE